MRKGIHSVHRSLIFRLIFLVGLVLSVSIFAWACFDINYEKNITAENVAAGADRLANTIRLGTHYAMMSNSREDINEIIRNIGRQEGIENIRILDGQGRIKFSSLPDEVDLTADIQADAGRILRKDEPPVEMRTRIFDSSAGYRLIGVRSPICNEANCSSAECHIHPRDERVLGTLDVVVSLEKTDRSVRTYKRRVIGITLSKSGQPAVSFKRVRSPPTGGSFMPISRYPRLNIWAVKPFSSPSATSRDDCSPTSS